MKINDTKRVGSVNPYKQLNNQNPLNGLNKKEKQKDQVVISNEAKELLETSNTARTEERQAQINELKKSVASGTYHVEAGKIAEKLLPYLK
jgi:negative regulator of flagellin synthesis FlgM